MPDLNPVVHILRSTNYSSASAADVSQLFNAVDLGGASDVDLLILENVRNNYWSEWSQSARTRWQQETTSLRGAQTVRPSEAKAPEPEDLSSTFKTLWMTGYDYDEQKTYVSDMAALAVRYGATLVLQDVSGQYSALQIGLDIAQRAGLSLNTIGDAVDIVRTKSPSTVWAEDNKILTNDSEVLVPPVIRESSLYAAEIFTENDGYHPYEYGFQGAVAYRREDIAAKELAQKTGRVIRTTRAYLEGGNIVPGTTADGKTFAMVGVDTIAVTAFHLEQEGTFAESQIQNKLQSMFAAQSITQNSFDQFGRKLRRAWGSTSQ